MFATKKSVDREKSLVHKRIVLLVVKMFPWLFTYKSDSSSEAKIRKSMVRKLDKYVRNIVFDGSKKDSKYVASVDKKYSELMSKVSK